MPGYLIAAGNIICLAAASKDLHILSTFKKAEKPECNVKPLWKYYAMLGHAQVSPMLFHQIIQFVLREYALCFMILVSIRVALLCIASLCIELLCKLSYPSSCPPHYPCTCFSFVKSSQASRLVHKERGFGLILVGLVFYRLLSSFNWRQFRNQTSDSMDRWKSRGRKNQRRVEKRREENKKEDQRRERVRRKNMQVRE